MALSLSEMSEMFTFLSMLKNFVLDTKELEELKQKHKRECYEHQEMLMKLEHEQKMARLEKHLELARLNYKMGGE